MPIHLRFAPCTALFFGLAACGGPQHVQPETAANPAENLATVETILGARDASGRMAPSASMVRIWDAKGVKLLDASAQPATRVTLKPGVYEFLLQCAADGKTQAPPRLGLRLEAGQRIALRCSLVEGEKMRVLSTSHPEPTAPGAR